ncbi:acyltransferase [alpha proteobacterium U9-1i]|nr:acyltransferase [alpha proteobacterium U9-1i]
MDAGATQQRFTVLDGLRGLAALVVVTDHVPSVALMNLLPGRYLAVDFSFALSGFVLAHVYIKRFAAGLGLGAFMRARAIRLYPLYIAATLLGAALAALKVSQGASEAGWGQVGLSTVLGAFYLPTPPGFTAVANEPFPFNGPAWSLFFELVVNVVFALIALRLTRTLFGTVLALGAAGVVWAAYHFGQLDGGFVWSNFVAGFPRVFYAFFVGVLIYRLRAHWSPPALPFWLSFVLLLVMFMIPTPEGWRWAWDSLAAIVLFPLLIAFSANSSVSGVASRACATAGMLSYGFYVFQVPVRDWTNYLLHGGAFVGGIGQVALVTMLTIAVASILHAVYDVPVRRFLTGRLLARQAGGNHVEPGKA